MTLQQRIGLLITSIGTDIKSLFTKQGNLATLTTTAKTDLVSAVNEIQANTTTNASPTMFEIVGGEFRIKDSYLIAFGTAQGWGSALPSLSASTVTFGTSTSTQNVVNWTAVTNATSYVVKRSANSGMTSPTTIYTGALLTFTDTGLTASTTYYYTVTASATSYNSSTSSVASKATSAGGATATAINSYQTDGFTVSTNNLTSTKASASAAARNSGDASTSTLALKTFEVGYDASWSGEIAFGLGTPNYAGAGFNAIEFAIYCPANRALQSKVTTGGTATALGYTLPAATTSKLRVRAAQDTTYWRVYFEYSTDSGTTWNVINTGGTLSAIAKTTAIYGLVVAFGTATQFKDIRGDV